MSIKLSDTLIIERIESILNDYDSSIDEDGETYGIWDNDYSSLAGDLCDLFRDMTKPGEWDK